MVIDIMFKIIFIQILVVFSAFIDLSDGKENEFAGDRSGSFSPREEISVLRSDVLDAAQILVNDLRGNDDEVKLFGVVKAAKQEVAGTLYHLDVLVERPSAPDSENVEIFQASVLGTKSKSWKIMFKKMVRKQTQEAASVSLNQAKHSAMRESSAETTVGESQNVTTTNSEPIPDSTHEDELREDLQVEATRNNAYSFHKFLPEVHDITLRHLFTA
mmetsp:Transcript_10067/g.13718  ORF Transcript_10067/g.13718 Transcript_10067/m.13718 type:complete len:216 (+) Transcript_10067:213-860(+)